MSTLIIFDKNPTHHPYQNELLQHTFEVSRKVESKHLFFFSGNDLPQFSLKENFDFRNQPMAPLAQRLSLAFKQALAEGSNKTVMVFSEFWELRSWHIEKAFLALDNNDTVLGPARDGSYYLLGMKDYHDQLFEDITWDGPQVMNETLARISRLRLSCLTLPLLNNPVQPLRVESSLITGL